MKSLRGNIITDGKVFEDHVISWANDYIVAIVPAVEFVGQAHKVSGWIVPGFIDVHNHGGDGGDFPSGNEQACRQAIAYHHRNGTTSLQASTVTADTKTLLETTQTLAGLCQEGLLEGIHLEGPFVSKKKCGAQDPRYIIGPDLELVDELVKAADGYLNTMTYAPELKNAQALVKHLVSNEVTPSLGHTNADVDVATEVLHTSINHFADHGVPTVTHTFNAMPPLHHREPGAITPCLQAAAAGKAIIELVADGTHLHPQLVSMLFTLVGAQNITLVTDAMAAAGLQDGEYKLGPARVIVKDSVARLQSDGAIAGGTSTLHQQLKLAVNVSKIDLIDVITSLTSTPARIIMQSRKLDRAIGTLHKDAYADIVVLNDRLDLEQVIRRGKELL